MAGALGLLGSIPGLVLPIAANAAGIGKNDTRAKTFAESGQYDPNRFEYGGEAGLASQTANRFAYGAQAAQARPGAQANYGGADRYAAQAHEARAGQNQLAGLMMGRATGAVPSIAQLQADRQMQQATAGQASAMASARGGAGLALAGQNAANNTATMQSAISNQAQINAANERMQAEQNAYGAYAGMRGGDQSAQGIATQQAQYNAGLQQQARAQNDAYSMGLYGQEANVRNAQLTASQNQQNMMANSHGQSTGMNVGISQNNANREFDYYKQFSGALQGATDGATASGMGGGGGGGQPNTGLAAPSATGLGSGGAATSMVGIPQPGTSDDRAKFGISPLGLLGMGGGGGGFGSAPGGGVDIGSKGYMSSGDIQQASTGLAGGGGGMPGMVGGGGITGGNMGDLGMPGGGGGMSGGLLSDDHAKLRAVYLQGRADAGTDAESAYPGLGSNEELMVGRDGARVRPTSFAGARTSGSGLTDREQAARNSEAASSDAPFSPEDLTPLGHGGNMINYGRAQAERHAGLGVERPTQGVGHMAPRERSFGAADGSNYAQAQSDPVTDQFAQGLAPIRFEYKPGMGPGGQQTGVRAQQAETQPLTSSMITRRPDGLRQIDPAMGLGTALAGVGHLAQKQKQNEALLAALMRGR